MNVNVIKATEYITDIKVVDIDAATEEEAQLTIPDLSQNHRVLPCAHISNGPYRGFFVVAVLTFSGSELPVGSTFSFNENSQHWKVIDKNKGAYRIRFSPDEYTEDRDKLKIKLREWAEKNGIEFNENSDKEMDHFPGYKNVLLDHKNLQRIAKDEVPEWKNALTTVKGVYCITDKSTGQIYIGSALGDEGGIWQRWMYYADVNDLTGGNKAFKELIRKGADHIITNFTYSILEVFDVRTDTEYILSREDHYKRVFQSVKYGMNNK
jgi:hypothetical protein